VESINVEAGAGAAASGVAAQCMWRAASAAAAAQRMELHGRASAHFAPATHDSPISFSFLFFRSFTLDSEVTS